MRLCGCAGTPPHLYTKCRPKEYVVRAERAVGNRQDLCVEGAKAPFIMRVYYLEYIDARMRVAGFSRSTAAPSAPKTVAGAG